MCGCVTLQRYNKSCKVTNDNDGKPNNYLLPFLSKETILGKTSKLTKYEELFTPQKTQKENDHHVVIQCNERCDGILCKQFQPSYLENE